MCEGSNQKRSLFLNEPFNQSAGIEMNRRRSCTMIFEMHLPETFINRTRLSDCARRRRRFPFILETNRIFVRFKDSGAMLSEAYPAWP